MVTTEGVSCITTQTNSKGEFFYVLRLRNRCMGLKEDKPCMIHEFTQEKLVNICMRDLQNTRVASDARVAHKESRAYTKKHILRVFLGIFRLWCLLKSFSYMKYLSKGADMRLNEVTKLKIWILQVRCFFNDFHEVSSWKCRHATK